MKDNNNTTYIVIGVAVIILALWLVIKFIGYILEHKLLFGIAIVVIIGGLIYYSRRK